MKEPRTRALAAAVLAAALPAAATWGGDWPQWRGPRAHRGEPGARPARALERHRERALEAPPAGRQRIDADRERRPGVPERGRRPGDRALVRREDDRSRLLEAPAGAVRGPRPPQAQHVDAVPGHRRRPRLRHDRQRGRQGLHRGREGALGPRPAEGLREVRPAVGLRQLAAPRGRRPLRPGAARLAHAGALVPPRPRAGHGEEPLPRGAADPGHPRVAGRLLDARGGPPRREDRRSS